MRFSVIFSIMLSVCLSLTGVQGTMAANVHGAPVVVDVEEINTRIGNAIASDEQWPTDALEVTKVIFGREPLNFIPMSEDQLQCTNNEKLVTVVIMRGGFSGNWGSGDWVEIHYRQEPDGTLRLCYILPMNKTGARTRDPQSPLKVRPTVHRVE